MTHILIEQISEWTKCSEKMPKESCQNFLLFCSKSKVYFGRYFNRNEYEENPLWVALSGYVDDDKKITHWMPIPKPPEEDK